MIRPLLITRSCVTSVSCVSAGSGGAASTSLGCGASTQGVKIKSFFIYLQPNKIVTSKMFFYKLSDVRNSIKL